MSHGIGTWLTQPYALVLLYLSRISATVQGIYTKVQGQCTKSTRVYKGVYLTFSKRGEQSSHMLLDNTRIEMSWKQGLRKLSLIMEFKSSNAHSMRLVLPL